ncbi:uncharacterized protein LOC129755278 isoform X2 [Uranotaenia lowii]|uniref:uncharacterized protein LOC129755278 isoform X2 n=1 Tax=Uranotaenia lowii TaxID=190385 RepID=UPI002479F235|nr:uncharacterized protein LOC129755278 isoform X2 [Uranotaenia lowii]
MIRPRPLMLAAVLILVTSGCLTLTDAVKAEKRVSIDSSALLEGVLCVIRSSPMQCIRQQAGRMLDNWEDILDTKKREMMEEADRENRKRAARDMKDPEDGSAPKQSNKITPSDLMVQIEEGLEAVADYVSDGVDDYVSSDSKSAMLQQLKKTANGKTDLGQIVHIQKLLGMNFEREPEANATMVDGNQQQQASVARSERDFDDDVSAVEDGLVDYGFGAGPEKAIGRGKRKGKKKKTYMKLFILGAVLKSKIELLLKVLSFHLQLKFFAIAFIGMLINIARFWIDLKKSPSPQKVIYYEHAQHQHHYDEHGDGEYGGYWKRSLHGLHDDDNAGYYAQDRADDRVYSNVHSQYSQVPNSPSHYPYDPHQMAYHQQRPYA